MYDTLGYDSHVGDIDPAKRPVGKCVPVRLAQLLCHPLSHGAHVIFPQRMAGVSLVLHPDKEAVGAQGLLAVCRRRVQVSFHLADVAVECLEEGDISVASRVFLGYQEPVARLAWHLNHVTLRCQLAVCEKGDRVVNTIQF